LNTGYCVKDLMGHEDRVNDLAINPKGTFMVSSGNKGDVILWSTDWKKDNCMTGAFDLLHEH